MKRHLMLAWLLVGAALTGLGASAGQDEKATAERLWNQAVAAKGGRAKLAEVRSLVVTERTSYAGNPLDPGFTRQRLYVFPSRVWEFIDHRPGKLGFNLGVVLDLEHPVEWGASGSVPARQSAVDSAIYALLEGQFLYLLETAFVKPVPTRARSGMVGRTAVDIVETTISSTAPFGYHSDVRVEYYLSQQSHLPVRVVTFRTPRPGRFPVDFVSERRYIFGNYIDVNGLQLPAISMTEGSPNTKNATSYRINVDYDERVFATRPLMREVNGQRGIGALDEWEKK